QLKSRAGQRIAYCCKRFNTRRAIAVDRKSPPVITTIPADVNLPIVKAGEHLPWHSGERSRHAFQRLLRQPAFERLPWTSAAPAVDDSLSSELSVMGTAGSWCGGDEPGIGVVGIDRQTPAIVPVAPCVRRGPTITAIMAPCGAAASRLIGSARDIWMPGKRVDVLLRTWAVVLPGFAAIGAAHQAAQLDADQKQADRKSTRLNSS